MILDFNKKYSLADLNAFCPEHTGNRDVLIHGVGPNTAKIICLQCKYACKFTVIDKTYCKLYWVQLDTRKNLVWMFEESSLINKSYNEIDFFIPQNPGTISIPKSIIDFPIDSDIITQDTYKQQISERIEKLLILI